MSKLLELWQYDWFKVVSCLLIGATVGVLFYPSKSITEREMQKLTEKYELETKETEKRHTEEVSEFLSQMSQQERNHREREETLNRKVETLTTENSSLKQSMKKRKFKLVKPDGTIIEKEYEESNSEQVTSVVTSVREEFTRKVKSIEDNWKKIHETRVAEIKKQFDEELEKARKEVKVVEKIVEKEKIVEVNKKKFRPEVGVTTEKQGYVHLSYPLWGPIVVGGGVSGSKTEFGDARVGAGIEF